MFFVDLDRDENLVVATPTHEVIPVVPGVLDELDQLHYKFKVMSSYRRLFPEFYFEEDGTVYFGDDPVMQVEYNGEYDELAELGSIAGDLR